MLYRSFLLPCMVFFFICIIFASSVFCQYREYYIHGKVVDTNNKAIHKVDIFLKNSRTSQNFRMSTNKKGEFKLIGLPHGVYTVILKKEGYEIKTDEWNFDSPKERMQKVELTTIVLVTKQQINEIQRKKEAKADFTKASKLVSQGNFDDAVTILNKMIKENPKDANAFYLLGICNLNKKMFSEAISSFSHVREINPSFAGVYRQLGICYQRQRELDKASQYYEKALELEPENVETLYNFGLILFEQDRVEEALAHFEKASELRPNDPEFLEMAGRCYIHQGKYSKAIEYLERSKDVYSDQEKVEFIEQLIKKLKEELKEKSPRSFLYAFFVCRLIPE